MLKKEIENNNRLDLCSVFWKWFGKVSYKMYSIKTKHYWKNRSKQLDKMYLSLVTDGESVLSKEQHAKIDELFSRYCKILHYSHAFYTEKTGYFDSRFIPDSLHRFVIDRYYNDWQAAKYIDNKCFYPVLFQDVNTPKTIVSRLNGIWYKDSWFGGCVIGFTQVLDLVMKEGVCFIKKATDSWGGLGVFCFDSNASSREELSTIIHSIPCDMVIQQQIRQSHTLSSINSDSVNTIRLISLLGKNGYVRIYSSILRMGIKGSRVDNASSGGISVGIKEDGRLKDVAYNNEGARYVEHPTSHVKFGSVIIPNFEAVKELVVRLHPRFPHFRMISWDIALDINDAPLLIEANLCDGELDFHQLNNGPLFGDDTERILSEVFHDKI